MVALVARVLEGTDLASKVKDILKYRVTYS